MVSLFGYFLVLLDPDSHSQYISADPGPQHWLWLPCLASWARSPAWWRGRCCVPPPVWAPRRGSPVCVGTRLRYVYNPRGELHRKCGGSEFMKSRSGSWHFAGFLMTKIDEKHNICKKTQAKTLKLLYIFTLDLCEGLESSRKSLQPHPLFRRHEFSSFLGLF